MPPVFWIGLGIAAFVFLVGVIGGARSRTERVLPGFGGCGCRCPGRGCRTATPGRSPPTAASSSSTPGSAARGGCASSTWRWPRPASASRTSGCSSAPTPTPTTTASPRSIVEAAGCELWMHPAWEHVRLLADDPAAALEQRLEVARQSGVPAAALERYRESRSDDEETGIDAIQVPDRELVPGVEVETDLGAWQVHETPGHAPSHVVLHQPERRLMISGDHLLGRTVLFFDYGHTPDPIGEFLSSLDRGRAARGRPLPARPRPPLPRPRGEDRRGAAPGRRAARQGPRLARRRRADRLRDRRRDRRPREPQLPGQRLGACRSSSPASTTWRSSARCATVDGTDPQRWALT